MNGVERRWGDTNCDGAVDALDALADLRFDAGLSVSLPGGCPDPEDSVMVGGNDLAWADTDCNGDVDSIDALRVLRHDAGLAVAGVPPCPGVGEEVVVS
jgi:hypothetical protein